MSDKKFVLDKKAGYFRNKGVDVMAFDDIYPEGHQSGVSIIMHGKRVASNGDIRFDKLPGQWHAVPKQCGRVLSETDNTIETSLVFPDNARKSGFNPIDYPDIYMEYKVNVRGVDGAVVVSVDLAQPLPEAVEGKVCFMLELYPGDLLGQPWILDDKQGIFPVQPNGPVEFLTDKPEYYKPEPGDALDFPPGDLIAAAYSRGRRLTICPNDKYRKLTIESADTPLYLHDGRMRHTNGWFIVSSDIPGGVTKDALRWVITPNVADDWIYTPVVQFSQVGYHPGQPKVAVIELDKRDTRREIPVLTRITQDGEETVFTGSAEPWGNFLRYSYLKFDFSGIREEGLYKIHYGASESSIFRIAPDIYDRGIWQPVLEYFLPVQMCHMRVNDKYRVWHGLCHMDDACMAPVNHNHFDGYIQGDSTLTKYNPGDRVPGLNIGGWHDAGDDDLRIESQAGECYILSAAFEEFGVDYDATTIDQESRIVEIHQPDGKNDILQQIEHGALSIIGAYKALGRLYRGIIVRSMRQYVILGDPSIQTDNIPSDDDRFVFTEDNPQRELKTAAYLAATARALKDFNKTLSTEALEAAAELFDVTDSTRPVDKTKTPWAREDDILLAKLHAAAELYLATGEAKYSDYIIAGADIIMNAPERAAWFIARVEKVIKDEAFSQAFRMALHKLKDLFDERKKETPYGIPYRPHIWGAGWEIQRQGFEYYFLHKAYPDIFPPDMVYDSLNFVLGCHPGSNNMSFASGVGAKSALIAYGWNRADWSFYPGGVISGTALIRPDFPELLDFPFLWQQTEYVLGGGSSHYMFLVLAAKHILSK